MKKDKVTYVMKTPLFEHVVFVDGVARAGKMLTCEIISRLERMDYFQTQSVIERACYMWHLNGLAEEFAASFIQFSTDELIYNRAIGRYLNTRIEDRSSIHRSPDVDEYLGRTTAEDGMAAVERFNQAGRVPIFLLHNTLPMAELLFDALPHAKLVHSCRHPVDQAIEWSRRGWGRRELADPLSFEPLVESPAGIVPWYALEWAERYLALNPTERAVESILMHHKQDDDAYLALGEEKRSKVYRVSFEHLVTGPQAIIDDFCEFFGTERRDGMDAFLKQENCPRVLGPAERRPMLEEISSAVGEETLDNLYAASRRYEEAWNLETVIP